MRLFRRRRKPRKPTWLPPVSTATREHAREVILARVDHWSAAIGITPHKVFIRNQRSRWGSASSLGNVSFNWRVARLTPSERDYVIIHELAHLREMNHSPAFWAIVARHCPRYKTIRKALRVQQIPVA